MMSRDKTSNHGPGGASWPRKRRRPKDRSPAHETFLAAFSETNSMTVIPLDDRILVRPFQTANKHGRMNTPVAPAHNKPMRGMVIAVGTGVLDGTGQTVASAVQAGDTILFGGDLGCEVRFGDNQYWIMKADDIVKVEVKTVPVALYDSRRSPVRGHPV
jgi:chaperonin GroES